MNLKSMYKVCCIALQVLFANACAYAQTTISSGSNEMSKANITLSYTIGEMAAVETFQSSQLILTQGFQQPQEETTTGITTLFSNKPENIIVYPNPADELLNIAINAEQPTNVHMILFDMNGRPVKELRENISFSQVFTIPVQELPSAIYQLRVMISSDGITRQILRTVNITDY